MQKLVRLRNPYNQDIDSFNREYLEKGWKILNMSVIETSTLIILLEKETRKDKLEHLNDL
jgi:hypothetical protein